MKRLSGVEREREIEIGCCNLLRFISAHNSIKYELRIAAVAMRPL